MLFRSNLAEIEWYNGKFAEARETYKEALDGRIAVLGINHPLTNETRIDLNFLIAAFVNKSPETAMKNLLILLQTKGLQEHPEKLKRMQDLL